MAKAGHGTRVRAARLVAAVVAAFGASPAHAAGPCSDAWSEPVHVASVEARLELRLDDGRLLRLAGLDPRLGSPEQPDGDERARERFAVLLAGRPIAIKPLATQPDRWGRLVAQAFADGSDLATIAVAAGLGRYLAEPGATACRAPLIAAEQAARAAKLGLWDDPYYAVLAVDDRAGFAERAGTLVIVEGRLASLSRDPYRTKLVFAGAADGSRRGAVLAATILPRVLKTFEARGVRVASLVGKRLRVRGLLDLRFGPQIELAGPDTLDVLDDAPTAETAAQ